MWNGFSRAFVITYYCCILFVLHGKCVNWTLLDWKLLVSMKCAAFLDVCKCVQERECFGSKSNWLKSECLFILYFISLLSFELLIFFRSNQQSLSQLYPFVMVLFYEFKQFCYGPFAVDRLDRVWNENESFHLVEIWLYSFAEN